MATKAGASHASPLSEFLNRLGSLERLKNLNYFHTSDDAAEALALAVQAEEYLGYAELKSRRISDLDVAFIRRVLGRTRDMMEEFISTSHPRAWHQVWELSSEDIRRCEQLAEKLLQATDSSELSTRLALAVTQYENAKTALFELHGDELTDDDAFKFLKENHPDFDWSSRDAFKKALTRARKELGTLKRNSRRGRTGRSTVNERHM